jgi:hypothetical protein
MTEKNILNVWGPGQLLAFSGIDGKTDYNNGLTARTSFSDTGIDIKLPGEGKIILSREKPLNVLLAGDFFTVTTVDGVISGAFVDAYHLLLQGACEFKTEAPELRCVRRDDRILIGSACKFNQDYIDLNVKQVIGARSRWLNELKLASDSPGHGRRAAFKAISQMKTQIYSSEGRIKSRWTTPDRWPHRQMWLWDSAFHAIGLRHIDPQMAREAIDAMFDVQGANGFMPLCASPYGEIKLRTQPPVLALAVKLVNEKLNSRAWIEFVYPRLSAYLKWNLENRDTDGNGLLEWAIDENKNCRSGESGMDNSPRFDSATRLDATDFNSFLALECEIVAEFAAELGYGDEAVYWRRRHARLCELMNEWLWNDAQGFYVDYDVDHQCQSEILASAGFLPLICGAPSPSQAARLAAHLENPATFKTPLPVASIALSCEKYYAKDMWRGPVWININWLIVMGLKRYGYDREAGLLAARTMDVVERMYEKYGTFFEFYDDRNEMDPPVLFRKANNVPDSFFQVFHDYGWSATLYLDMLLSSDVESGGNSPKNAENIKQMDCIRS